jgi:predicted ATPase
MNYLDMWGNSSLYNPKIGIQKIRLSNFKSIERSDTPIEIELSPLTLLCGENSSGKSTLLHSILLLLQSLNAEKITSSTFPLNGKLIKLNELSSILHGSKDDYPGSTPQQIAGERKKDFELNIGVDFNSPLVRSVKGTEQSDTIVKFDITLSPELDMGLDGSFRGLKPFPNNSETIIEVVGKRTDYNSKSEGEGFTTYETKETLSFSRLDVDHKVNIFRINNGAEVKKHANYRWKCEYEELVKNKKNDLTFGGVEFISGVPSKVMNRELITDYLARKMTEQVKTMLEDKNWLMDVLFYWENSEEVNIHSERNNIDPHKLLIESFTNTFDIVTGETVSKDLSEFRDLKLDNSLPEEAFCLNWNTMPWFAGNYKDFYINNSQLGIDLINLVNSNPMMEYEEIMQTVFWDIGPVLAREILYGTELEILYGLDPEDISEAESEDLDVLTEDQREEVLKSFLLLLDTKFYIGLQNQLFKKFDLLFSKDQSEEIYQIDQDEGENDYVTENIEETNYLLNNLRKAAAEVKYIGPLRMLENNEIKIETFDKNIPLGLNGEHFFNYYEENKDKPYNRKETDSLEKIKEFTISNKFDETLKYFGIADEFSTFYNHENDSIVGSIKPIGLNKIVRMRELGVGFSQLAPIILLCITSNPGTTILLEQPELHLHPQVQQKFADFIIEMITQNGLQIILETHSDHMLNRIRRRIAQAKLEENDSTLFENCSILFAEREEGVTQFRKANLTNSGTYDLTDFPKGFFDQGAEDAFFILKASMEEDNN